MRTIPASPMLEAAVLPSAEETPPTPSARAVRLVQSVRGGLTAVAELALRAMPKRRSGRR